MIFALAVVGVLEKRANLKPYPMTYEVRGSDQPYLLESILGAMDKIGQRLADIESSVIGDVQRITFHLTATSRQASRFRGGTESRAVINKLLTFRDPEDD